MEEEVRVEASVVPEVKVEYKPKVASSSLPSLLLSKTETAVQDAVNGPQSGSWYRMVEETVQESLWQMFLKKVQEKRDKEEAEVKAAHVVPDKWTARERARGWHQVQRKKTKPLRKKYDGPMSKREYWNYLEPGTVRCDACGDVRPDTLPGSAEYRQVDATGVQDVVLCGRCRAELAWPVDKDYPLRFPSNGTTEWWWVDRLGSHELQVLEQDSRLANCGLNGRKKNAQGRGEPGTEKKSGQESQKPPKSQKMSREQKALVELEALIESRVVAELARRAV